ncbi:unnamed protein product [Discosporangium mesarthrocarpum]
MKRAQNAKTLIQLVDPLIKTGLIGDPKWLPAVKQIPPYTRRPSEGLKELTLPWDKLARIFERRNPHMLEDPLWLGSKGLEPGGPLPLSHVFAKRQYALMQKGMSQDEAYIQADKAMKRERAEALASVRRMVTEASTVAGGTRPSFIADPATYDGLRQWQAMLDQTSYEDWSIAGKESLDDWLIREVMCWDESKDKQAKEAGDATAEGVRAEAARLRVTLFPSTRTREYLCPSDVVGLHEQDENWCQELEAFREHVSMIPHEKDWTRTDRLSLTMWLINHTIKPEVLEEVLDWAKDGIKVKEPHTGTGEDRASATSGRLTSAKKKWEIAAMEEAASNKGDIAAERLVMGEAAAMRIRKAVKTSRKTQERMTLGRNVELVLNHAKRQLLPGLVLWTDERMLRSNVEEKKMAQKKKIWDRLRVEEDMLDQEHKNMSDLLQETFGTLPSVAWDHKKMSEEAWEEVEGFEDEQLERWLEDTDVSEALTHALRKIDDCGERKLVHGSEVSADALAAKATTDGKAFGFAREGTIAMRSKEEDKEMEQDAMMEDWDDREEGWDDKEEEEDWDDEEDWNDKEEGEEGDHEDEKRVSTGDYVKRGK